MPDFKEGPGYKQKGIDFGKGTGRKDPEDQKNWTGNEESGSKQELKNFRKDRNKAIRQGKFKKAANIHKDVKSSKAAIAYAKGNDKKGDRLTEGSKLRQGLRTVFGKGENKS
jgi:hypothetical protein